MRRTFVLLTAGLLAFSLAAPAAVMAASRHTYLVPKPNGTDDTANIQTGLDWCAAHGPNCTVQLRAGTYKTSQLVEYNFRGTFEGAGQNRTTIEALPDLLVTEPDFFTQGECAPNLITCRWSSFITFADGSVEVSDLSLDFPWTNGRATKPWMFGGVQTNGLGYALGFTADGRASASVDHVSVTGRADTSPTSILGTGFNVLEGIVFDGYFPNPPPGPSQTYVPRSGSFAVRNSSVRTAYEGVVVSGAITSSQVTLAGNRINDVDVGIDVGAANSTFDISYNTVAATNAAPEQINHAGVFVEPSAFSDLVSRLSRFSIHDNDILVKDACGCAMVGIHLFDATYGAPHWFTATVTDNTISLPSPAFLDWKEGISANNTAGTLILGNTISDIGSTVGATDAITLWGNDPAWPPATNNAVIGNDVSRWTPVGTQLDPVNAPGWGLSQIYLDPYTGHTLVVCLRHTDTVIDDGTGNMVIGCDPSTTTSKAAAVGAASVTGRLGLKAKPWLP